MCITVFFYQGLHPIDEGLEFFDAGAKYHVHCGSNNKRFRLTKTVFKCGFTDSKTLTPEF